ncbi:hypothetical protein FOPG_18640 [Fusarium oxysporum f. sp. conglutinans race 2 54008]|uniref:Uncharacterized protein n=1 Tax=Fusarium oxysporum f. sp. conglutinans race 2 54008 TaxID=1089457 RepID=X0GZ68_FUSOX|nr:hypothetical protein FOPG_18640 [Fusarium oxysporum f. sp. conglutinans race 2 54008]
MARGAQHGPDLGLWYYGHQLFRHWVPGLGVRPELEAESTHLRLCLYPWWLGVLILRYLWCGNRPTPGFCLPLQLRLVSQQDHCIPQWY